MLTLKAVATRLHARLVLIAIVAVIPAIAAIAGVQSVARDRARERAIADNLRLARLAAGQQAAVFDGARRLLLTLADLPPLRAADPRGCREMLPNILRSHPTYFNIAVANADGSVFCAGAPVDPRQGRTVGGRVWFERAMRTAATSIGDYQISATTGKPAIVVAHPLLDASGDVVRVIAVTLSLDGLNAVVSQTELPPGGTLTLFDSARTILARFPNGGPWIGKQVPDSGPLSRLIAGADQDISEGAGVDGTIRFYVTLPVRAAIDTKLYVGMGVDHSTVFREADRMLGSFLWLLLIVSAAAIGAAALAGHMFVIKPARALRRVTEQIAAGDLSARAQLDTGIAGIGELEEAINIMASALDAREREGARAEGALLERIATTALGADVGMSLNRAHDLQLCLQSCAEALIAHLDAAGASIWTLDEAGSVLELQSAAGVAAGRRDVLARMDATASGIGRIARHRRAHFSNDAIGDPDVDDQDWMAREGLRTFVGCPLVVESHVVGVVALFGRAPLSEVMATAIASTADLIALGIARHRAEAARRLLAAIVANSDDAIVGATIGGVIVSWNDGACKLSGYTSEEAVGQQASLLCPDNRLAEHAALLDEVRKGHRVTNRESIRQRKDGSLVPVSISLSPIRNAAGEIAGISATIRNMTERQAAERTVRESEERFRLIAETVTQVFWIADVSISSIVYVSPAYEHIWGRSCESLYRNPRSFLDAIHADDREAVLRTLEIQNQGRPFDHEYRIARPDGEVRWIRDRGFPVPVPAGAVAQYVGVAEDITGRRSLEEQLRQSQKMEAIGQLAGGVAHDFNNLLTAILGFSSFLAQSLPDGDQRRDVDEIRHAAERAADLTRQLLAFGRKQIFEVRVLHLGDVVSELTPMLRRLLGESIDLATTIGDRGVVKADPGQLQQVLMNLAVNARDAMRSGGRLTIETTDVMLDEAFVQQHPSTSPGPHVMLTMTDTGHGMDAAVQKHIFEPFFTTKPQGQGTGLGLATAYGIVKQSGGSIWVESAPGRGTAFTVCLPKTEERPAAAAAPVADEVKGGAETILLVEDEELVRDWVSRVLRRRGYSVHAFGDPAHAISYAQERSAPIDLVLSDVILPEISGKTMVAHILERHPESRALFMSGYADHAIVQEGVLDAGTWFLQKPFSAELVARKVREVIDADTATASIPHRSPPGGADRPQGAP